MSNRILQFTSSLFGSIVLHAYYKQDTLLHLLCLIQTILSILNHSTPNFHVIRSFDILFAVFLYSYGTFHLIFTHNPLVLFSFMIAMIWTMECISCKSHESKTLAHAFLHLVSIIGLHLYLYYL
jgi:hypothetical protein